MNMLSPDSLTAYWSAPEVETNIIVFFNILGALLLGLFVGYERSYHGRAAGMRTYGLVCMAFSVFKYGSWTKSDRLSGFKACMNQMMMWFVYIDKCKRYKD